MDIHKPKPWRGGREFIKEIGTIVIGVLIALGAEQAVEWLHWQQRVSEAEESMRGALSRSTVYAQIHLAVEACEIDMLEKVRTAILAPGEDWRPPYVIQDARGAGLGLLEVPVSTWSGEAWRDAQADGTVNHLSVQARTRYSSAFARLAEGRATNDVEADLEAELASLDAPRRLDSQSRTEYLRLIARAEKSVRGVAVHARQVLRDTGRLGIKPLDPKSTTGPVLAFHRSVCDQFHAGKTTIVVNLGGNGN